MVSVVCSGGVVYYCDFCIIVCANGFGSPTLFSSTQLILTGIEKNMKLGKHHTEPSRMALLNYGNTSSSSIWYEMEYIMEEQKSNPLRKGDRIMQVAFGSGFKCTSGVWLRL